MSMFSDKPGNDKRDDNLMIWKYEHFEFGDRIGRGGFGICFEALNKVDNKVYALKSISLSRIQCEKDQEQLTREITIQKGLDHENIVKLYGDFVYESNVYLVLEHLPNGNLYELILSTGRLTEYQTAVYVSQLADALHFLHQNGIIHRDVKPDNAILDADYNLKIGDFGSALVSDELKGVTLCGTRSYLAPERYTLEPYNYKIDVWGLGVITYEMLTGRHPFDWGGNNDQDLDRRIIQTIYAIPTKLVNVEARGVIRRLVVADPKCRMELDELMSCSWIQNVLKKGETPAENVPAAVIDQRKYIISGVLPPIAERIQHFEKQGTQLGQDEKKKTAEKLKDDRLAKLEGPVEKMESIAFADETFCSDSSGKKTAGKQKAAEKMVKKGKDKLESPVEKLESIPFADDTIISKSLDKTSAGKQKAAEKMGKMGKDKLETPVEKLESIAFADETFCLKSLDKTSADKQKTAEKLKDDRLAKLEGPVEKMESIAFADETFCSDSSGKKTAGKQKAAEKMVKKGKDKLESPVEKMESITFADEGIISKSLDKTSAGKQKAAEKMVKKGKDKLESPVEKMESITFADEGIISKSLDKTSAGKQEAAEKKVKMGKDKLESPVEKMESIAFADETFCSDSSGKKTADKKKKTKKMGDARLV